MVAASQGSWSIAAMQVSRSFCVAEIFGIFFAEEICSFMVFLQKSSLGMALGTQVTIFLQIEATMVSMATWGSTFFAPKHPVVDMARASRAGRVFLNIGFLSLTKGVGREMTKAGGKFKRYSMTSPFP